VCQILLSSIHSIDAKKCVFIYLGIRVKVMEYIFDHFGVPVLQKREGMRYFPEFKVWCSDYEKDPYRIEWIFFEKGNAFHSLIQTHPHVCFLVKDIETAIRDKKILLKPTHYQSYSLAFIEEKGVPIEFIQLPDR
jgi:hypothetical protein